MVQNIEITDRYGGNPPAWLRSCLECEAMGFYPLPCSTTTRSGGSGIAPVDTCPLPDDHVAADFDGWHFLRCEDCNGTGSVPWYRSVARVPRWLWRSTTFFWTMSARRYQPAHFTYPEHLWLVFKCAFLYELRRLWQDARS